MHIELVIGKLAENATMNLFSLFDITTKTLYSSAREGTMTQGEIGDASTWIGYKCIFRPDNVY